MVTDCLFFGRLLCIAVEVGLEKRRYLAICQRNAAKFLLAPAQKKCLVSATFFTERERPAGTAVHKKGVSSAGFEN